MREMTAEEIRKNIRQRYGIEIKGRITLIQFWTGNNMCYFHMEEKERPKKQDVGCLEIYDLLSVEKPRMIEYKNKDNMFKMFKLMKKTMPYGLKMHWNGKVIAEWPEDK